MRMFPNAIEHELDGYQLYELLKDGDRFDYPLNGKTYRLQFVGSKYGSNNYLRVTHPDGTVGKFGWGWNSDLCFEVLDALAAGNHSNYRPYLSKLEGEK